MTRRKTLVRSMELATAVPAVIAMRTARMLAAGATPTAADRREMARMVDEKVGAFTQSWWAMAAQQQRAAMGMWTVLAQAWWTPWLHSAPPTSAAASKAARALQRRMLAAQATVFASGLAPLHRAATANLRRLSRRSR